MKTDYAVCFGSIALTETSSAVNALFVWKSLTGSVAVSRSIVRFHWNIKQNGEEEDSEGNTSQAGIINTSVVQYKSEAQSAGKKHRDIPPIVFHTAQQGAITYYQCHRPV